MSLDSCASNNVKRLAYQCINGASNKWRKYKDIPLFLPQQLSNKEIKRQTNWESEDVMMQYVLVVCNGEFNKLQKRVSTMAWFEEWLLYFELIWGRTLLQQEDVITTYYIPTK